MVIIKDKRKIPLWRKNEVVLLNFPCKLSDLSFTFFQWCVIIHNVFGSNLDAKKKSMKKKKEPARFTIPSDKIRVLHQYSKIFESNPHLRISVLSHPREKKWKCGWYKSRDDPIRLPPHQWCTSSTTRAWWRTLKRVTKQYPLCF